MDRIDKKILHLLQHNGRIHNLELAEQVSLSPSPCLRRVKQLEEEGYIKQYVALLDPKKLELNLTVLVSVGLTGHTTELMQGFEAAIRALPEVLFCYLITGQSADYLLKVIVPDMEHYQTFLLKKLISLDGVATVHSSFVLQSIVDKTAYPL
jgi:Lrp/AsnC family leucine-responsive transcriptional regulator